MSISAKLSVPSCFVVGCNEVELALLQKSLFLSRELFHTSIAIHFIWMPSDDILHFAK
jgi:hypothetical protein